MKFKSQQKALERLGSGVLLAIICAGSFFPIFWMFSTALQPPSAVMCTPPKFLFQPTLHNFDSVFSKPDFVKTFMNSLITAAVTSILVVVLAFPAAYSLARFPIRRKGDIAFFILSLKMFPPIAVVIPFFIMYRKLGLYDTQLGLVLLHTAVNIPLAVWLLSGTIKELPVTLEESALVDGATPLQVLLKIVLPLAGTGISAAAIFTFIMSWNEFFFALILTGRNSRTLPVFLYTFMTFREIKWGPLMALGSFMTLPIVVLSVFFRKYLIEGITLGALKE